MHCRLVIEFLTLYIVTMKSIFVCVISIPYVISIEAKTYTPDWPSLDSRPLPDWYDDAKFGIFMHFGTSVVPGNSIVYYWYNCINKI